MRWIVVFSVMASLGSLCGGVSFAESPPQYDVGERFPYWWGQAPERLTDLPTRGIVVIPVTLAEADLISIESAMSYVSVTVSDPAGNEVPGTLTYHQTGLLRGVLWRADVPPPRGSTLHFETLLDNIGMQGGNGSSANVELSFDITTAETPASLVEPLLGRAEVFFTDFCGFACCNHGAPNCRVNGCLNCTGLPGFDAWLTLDLTVSIAPTLDGYVWYEAHLSSDSDWRYLPNGATHLSTNVGAVGDTVCYEMATTDLRVSSERVVAQHCLSLSDVLFVTIGSPEQVVSCQEDPVGQQFPASEELGCSSQPSDVSTGSDIAVIQTPDENAETAPEADGDVSNRPDSRGSSNEGVSCALSGKSTPSDVVLLALFMGLLVGIRRRRVTERQPHERR